ncbi:hypothetical protein SOVF_079760 [Spinacia oleracea]|nr:hypothetical protein SOVF_079760 [Spinacia oleracea]
MTLLEASFSSSSDHIYATQLVAFSGGHNIDGLVQCTLDLSPIYCQRCLQSAIVEVLGLDNHQFRGGRLLSKS